MIGPFVNIGLVANLKIVFLLYFIMVGPFDHMVLDKAHESNTPLTSKLVVVDHIGLGIVLNLRTTLLVYYITNDHGWAL